LRGTPLTVALRTMHGTGYKRRSMTTIQALNYKRHRKGFLFQVDF
jgi:hypothetical protein